jgi:hypothetical protein
VLNEWVLLSQQTPVGPSITAGWQDQSQGRHNQTRMCATTTMDVNATKLEMKIPWNSCASLSFSADIMTFGSAID